VSILRTKNDKEIAIFAKRRQRLFGSVFRLLANIVETRLRRSREYARLPERIPNYRFVRAYRGGRLEFVVVVPLPKRVSDTTRETYRHRTYYIYGRAVTNNTRPIGVSYFFV